MANYIIRRLLLMIPTLAGIMLVNFLIIQVAPGGPVEQTLARVKGQAVSAAARISGGESELGKDGNTVQTQNAPQNAPASTYRGARGLDPNFIAEIEHMYGFDKPLPERFWLMVKSYLRFDFGYSWFKGRKVTALLLEKMPVSISLGLWSTLIIYAISIPLGIRKAARDGSAFDIWTSAAIVVGSAIPGFLFAILLIVLFAGGSYAAWFPLRGLVSVGWHDLSWPQKIADYFWHIALPVLSMVIGGFASLTLLTKNSFLDQINLQYVLTARAKGLSEMRVLYGHVFRNAMLIVIAGLPAAFIGMLFTGALLTEIIFSLDGIGLLGYEAVMDRDYPVIFATLYIFTLLGLVTQLMGDVIYMLIDPRIDFEARAL